MNENTPLIEVKKHLRNNWEKGTDCPACGQLVRRYSRPMHSTMAATLIRLHALNAQKAGYYHVKDIVKGISDTGTNDFSKLRYWDFIVEMPKDKDDTKKRTSGYWRITDKGTDFVMNRLTVQSHVLLFNKHLLGFEGNQINIKEALGEKFNYTELMGY